MECDNNNDIGNASVKALDNKLCSEACLPGEWQSAEHELYGCREVGGETFMLPTLITCHLPDSKQHITFGYMYNYTTCSDKQQGAYLLHLSDILIRNPFSDCSPLHNVEIVSQLLGEFSVWLSPKNPRNFYVFFLRVYNNLP